MNGTSEENTPEDDPAARTARTAFGIRYLYPWQRLVIANILDAAETSVRHGGRTAERGTAPEEARSPDSGYSGSAVYDEDGALRGRQIILLPTGAGKSLCFLIPALMLGGPTLILYPLLALISDQARRMRESGIDPVVFRGQQNGQEREECFRRIRGGARVILANPEVLQSEKLLDRLKETGIVHMAVDEAHCISEWGDSFRPAYLTLGTIAEKLKVPVVSAFTATASPPVLARIAGVLFNGTAHIVRGEADRPNISYSVIHAAAKRPALLRAVMKNRKPAIVFCSTRKKAENCARFLLAYLGGTDVKFYHAGLSKEEKAAVETWFRDKKNAILTATCAFGMGVDKKDIRTVIHFDPPPSAEAYIQEAGRAGRDGQNAKAILIWTPENSEKALSFPEKSRERILYDFAVKGTCRREVLLGALGAEQAACSGCDICEGTAVQQAAETEAVYAFIVKNRRRYTLPQAVSFVREQANDASFDIYGKKMWEESDAAAIFGILLAQNRIVIRNKYPWKGTLDIPKNGKGKPLRG